MGKSELWKIKVARCGDILFDDAREGDIIVPVMGLTGVGKSTFINNYLDQENAAPVLHALISCTETPQAFCCPLPPDEKGKARRLVLVDTPSIDHTSLGESEILRRIAVWLASSYGPGKTCGGVIYLHDMGRASMRGSALTDLQILQGLCGKKNLGSVVFAITARGGVTPEIFASREEQLSNNYWKEFKMQGAIVFKLLPTHKSADELVRTVLERVSKKERVLLIQKELVDHDKTLPETEAGRAVMPTPGDFGSMVDARQPESTVEESIKNQENAKELKLSQRLLKFVGLGPGKDMAANMAH